MYRRHKAELLRLGIHSELAHMTAWSVNSPWRISPAPGVRIVLNNRYFDALGLVRLDPSVNI